MHLDDAGFIGNGLALGLDVYKCPWDSGGCEADFHKGQVEEKEVHGCVQVEV
jgi:hypothetical protein